MKSPPDPAAYVVEPSPSRTRQKLPGFSVSDQGQDEYVKVIARSASWRVRTGVGEPVTVERLASEERRPPACRTFRVQFSKVHQAVAGIGNLTLFRTR